jgi:transcriptional regulator with GAF, ATPase, and Fis domain
MTPRRSSLHVENVGKQELLHNNRVVSSCVAHPGDTLAIRGSALFLLSNRPRLMAELPLTPFPFGEPDSAGMIGESEAAWELRSALAACANTKGHVLLLGASGSGKELAARAVHQWSSRANKPFVSRNAATLPSGILEAELFGNAANYPQSGMPARVGLFGAADGGTLFLDEIGELSERDQAAFLRVLDAGEYQRLGEDRTRRSSLRVVAATNRPPSSLKFDLLARFSERIHLPDLNQRRGDISLIANHLLRSLSAEHPELPKLRLSFELASVLIRNRYVTHARELERLLRCARPASPEGVLGVTPSVEEALRLPEEAVEISAETVRRALAESRSSSDAARRLGLPSRFALHRLTKKLGIVTSET